MSMERDSSLPSRDNSLTDDCDVFPRALGEDRRPSIVYEEDMPVIVRRRGVTMTVRIFGAEDDQAQGGSGARVARSVSCSEQPSCISPTKRFSLATRKKRTSKSVSSLEDVRNGSILCWFNAINLFCVILEPNQL